MKAPVVILSFADSRKTSSPLTAVTQESNQLHRLFVPFENRGIFDLRYFPNVELEDLAVSLKGLRRKVTIWHFGGHAAEDIIKLENTPVILAHLAPVFAKYWRPELVFLNGCNTEGMASPLLNAGVKVVIASNSEVGDKLASAFAKHFYESWLQGNSISDSFDLANSIILASNTEASNVGPLYTRHLNSAASDQLTELPWRIFFKEGRLSYGDQKLTHLGASKKRNWLNSSIIALVILLGSSGVYHFGKSWLEEKVEKGTSNLVDRLDFQSDTSYVPPDTNIVHGEKPTEGSHTDSREFLNSSTSERHFSVTIRDQYNQQPRCPISKNLELIIEPESGKTVSLPLEFFSVETRLDRKYFDGNSKIYVRDKERVYSNPDYRLREKKNSDLNVSVRSIHALIKWDSSTMFEGPEWLKIQIDACENFEVYPERSPVELHQLLPYFCWEAKEKGLRLSVHSDSLFNAQAIGNLNIDSLTALADPGPMAISIH